MSLQIQLECPQCNKTLLIELTDYTPGRRKNCSACNDPMRMTKAGLERFSQDVQRLCQGKAV